MPVFRAAAARRKTEIGRVSDAGTVIRHFFDLLLHFDPQTDGSTKKMKKPIEKTGPKC